MQMGIVLANYPQAQANFFLKIANMEMINYDHHWVVLNSF